MITHRLKSSKNIQEILKSLIPHKYEFLIKLFEDVITVILPKIRTHDILNNISNLHIKNVMFDIITVIAYYDSI